MEKILIANLPLSPGSGDIIQLIFREVSTGNNISDLFQFVLRNITM